MSWCSEINLLISFRAACAQAADSKRQELFDNTTKISINFAQAIHQKIGTNFLLWEVPHCQDIEV